MVRFFDRPKALSESGSADSGSHSAPGPQWWPAPDGGPRWDLTAGDGPGMATEGKWRKMDDTPWYSMIFQW